MFADLALSPDENIASAFISFSEMQECCSLYFHQKIANCVIKLSNFGLRKPGKIIKIPYFLSNSDVSNKFAKFQCFDKKMTNSMFVHPKTPIKAKYKCQEEEKAETENSIQTQ